MSKKLIFMNAVITILYLKFTFNNIFIHWIGKKNIIKTYSLGKLGLKNRKKKTPFAFKTLNTQIFSDLKLQKITQVSVILNGFGVFKQTFLYIFLKEKNLIYPSLKFLSILDTTKIPYNGCKLKKKRHI